MPDTIPVRQQIVAQLRSAIFALQFTPGEKLVERRLCEMTGASRTALREGLRQLEAEGLILIIPNRGPIVPKLSRKNAADIYHLRSLLEPDLAQQAAQNANGRDISELRKIATRVEASLLEGGRMSLINSKNEFYEWLMRIGDNEETNVVMRKLLGRTAIIWPSTVLEDRAANEHSVRLFSDLVEAIAAHDCARAAQAALVHVKSAGDFVIENIEDDKL